MEAKKQGKMTLRTMLMLFAFIPFLSALLILGFVSAMIMKNNIESSIEEELALASKSLREYYEYDLINGNDLEDGFIAYDTEFIDRMAMIGVDFTVFKDNIRFMTTIKGSDGKRIEGTPASDAVWAAVSKGEDYYSDDVVINGVDYYVYYMPLGTSDKVYGMAFSGKPATDIKKAERHLYLIIFGIGAGLFVLFLFLVLWLSKKVADPISDTAKVVEEMAEGKIHVELNAHSNIKETVLLVSGAKKLAANLEDAISGITRKTAELVGHSDRLNSSSNENANSMVNLSQAAGEIASGASSQAEEVQNAAEAVTEVVSNIENINEAVNSTMSATDVMSEDSNRVVTDFDSLINDTNLSIEKLNAISEKMNTVAAAVDNVNTAAGEINGIASQTNLLSLNASIEAARAGEAGRGFAVVASEISSLSDQSNTAAGTIKDIMSNLKSETDDAVKMVSDLAEVMKKQGETSRQSQESLSQLIGAIAETKEQVELVKSGSDAVSIICERLNEIIQNLSAISEENAASAQETSASIEQVSTNTSEIQGMSDELKGVSNTLKELTAYFDV